MRERCSDGDGDGRRAEMLAASSATCGNGGCAGRASNTREYQERSRKIGQSLGPDAGDDSHRRGRGTACGERTDGAHVVEDSGAGRTVRS